MNVSPLEGFFMRLLFALALIFTIRFPVQFEGEPHPVGLLKLLHKIDDHRAWLTWLSDSHTTTIGNWTLKTYEIFRWSFIALMLPYVTGFALPLVLPVAAFLHILPFTLFNSQGYTYHGSAMISTVLLVQALTVLYYSFKHRFTVASPDAKLRGWMLVQSMVIVTGAYFISVIAKMEASHGMWFMNSNNVALDMIKTERQTFFNHNEGPPPGITPEELQIVQQIGITDVMFRAKSYPIQIISTWLLEHPWTARILFGSGVMLELVCILAIGNRVLAFFLGICLLAFHRSIDMLMSGVAFPNNEICDFIFLVGLPFGFAWLLEWIKSVRVRQALIIGAIIGAIASYWFHEKTGEATSSLGNYFITSVNVLFGTWAVQEWGNFFEFLGPVFIASGIGAVVAAVMAAFWPVKKPLTAAS